MIKQILDLTMDIVTGVFLIFLTILPGILVSVSTVTMIYLVLNVSCWFYLLVPVYIVFCCLMIAMFVCLCEYCDRQGNK